MCGLMGATLTSSGIYWDPLVGSPRNTLRCGQAGRDRDLRRSCWGQEKRLVCSPLQSPDPPPPWSSPALEGRWECPGSHLVLKCSCGCFLNFSAVNSVCLSCHCPLCIGLCPVSWDGCGQSQGGSRKLLSYHYRGQGEAGCLRLRTFQNGKDMQSGTYFFYCVL